MSRPQAGRAGGGAQTVLVVDDSPPVLALVDDSLRADYQVRAATSGSAALALLERDHAVDLILLDVMMPDMDGFETCQRIKADARWRDIPIIFLTALSGNGDEVHGLRLGAVDYIAKPVVPITLRARVRTHMELCRVRRELERSNARLQAERELIEAMTLRMRADPDFDARHLRCLMQPMERTSGDICLAAFCPDGRQMVLVGDFTGHGLVAAIGGGGARQVFHAACARNATLETLARELNAWLYQTLLQSQFMAAIMVEVSAGRDHVRLWGGGMCEPLYADRHGHVQPIALNGFPLGLLPQIELDGEVRSLSVLPGERLLLYSDGCVEAVDLGGQMYGTDRLLRRYGELPAGEALLQSLLADVEDFASGQPQRDDFVLLEIHL